MCDVIHIPAAFQKQRAVTFDAKAHGFDPVDDEAMQALDAAEALTRLAANLGSYARLARILRNIAYIHGEDL